jgi:hypothetical protein
MTQENKTVQVNITLEQAREWAQSGNKTLRELAESAFSYYELFPHLSYEKIQCMGDVLDYLGIKRSDYLHTIDMLKYLNDDTLIHTYKINLIAKAINGKDWIPSDLDAVYIPEIILEVCTKESLPQLKKRYENFHYFICITKDDNWINGREDFRYAVFMYTDRLQGHANMGRSMNGNLTNEIYFETHAKLEHTFMYFGRELFDFYKGTAPLK